MVRGKERRVKGLNLRLTQKEYDLLREWVKGSTCRKSSVFVRNVLFRKPFQVLYRSKSTDEFLSVALKLKNELNNIGNNFNQAIKRLHTMQSKTELAGWIINMKLERRLTPQKTDEIGSKLHDIYELLSEEAQARKRQFVGPILLDSNQAAAADEQENKAVQ